jgi:hypothetical protein
MHPPEPAPVEMGADIRTLSKKILDSRIRGNDMLGVLNSPTSDSNYT